MILFPNAYSRKSWIVAESKEALASPCLRCRFFNLKFLTEFSVTVVGIPAALRQRTPEIDNDLAGKPVALQCAVLRVRRRHDHDVGALDEIVERRESLLRQIGIVAEHLLGLDQGEL